MEDNDLMEGSILPKPKTYKERKLDYIKKYNKENIAFYVLKFNKKKYPNLFEKMESQQNKNAYLLSLIEKDIEGK